MLIHATIAAMVLMGDPSGAPEPPPRDPAGSPAPAADGPSRTTPASQFPHVRVDVRARTVELDAVVPIDAHAADGKGGRMRVFLEIVACSPDTREHETLVVTSAKPSHVHAALLMIGLEPGEPGSWRDVEKPGAGGRAGGELTFDPPRGDEVIVEFVRVTEGGRQVVETPSDWIVNARTGARIPDHRWVFAGSRMVTRQGRERYDADGAGTIIGLHTFGSEVLAFPDGFNPSEDAEEPVWIADAAAMPKVGAAVTVRIRAAEKE